MSEKDTFITGGAAPRQRLVMDASPQGQFGVAPRMNTETKGASPRNAPQAPVGPPPSGPSGGSGSAQSD